MQQFTDKHVPGTLTTQSDAVEMAKAVLEGESAKEWLRRKYNKLRPRPKSRRQG